MGFQVTLAPTSSHQPTQGWFCCSGGCDSWEHRGKYPLRQEEHQQLPPQGAGSCLASLLSHSPQGCNPIHELCKAQIPSPNTDTPTVPKTSLCPELSSGTSQPSPTALTPGIHFILWIRPSEVSDSAFKPFLLPAWDPIHLGCHW